MSRKNQTKIWHNICQKQNYYQNTQIKSLGYTNTDTPFVLEIV